MYNGDKVARAEATVCEPPSNKRGQADGRNAVGPVGGMTDELISKAGATLSHIRYVNGVMTEQLDRLMGATPEVASDYVGLSGTSALHTLSEQLDYIRDEVARAERLAERLACM